MPLEEISLQISPTSAELPAGNRERYRPDLFLLWERQIPFSDILIISILSVAMIGKPLSEKTYAPAG